jgi:hypothetical protein
MDTVQGESQPRETGSEGKAGSYRKPIAIRLDLIPSRPLVRLASIYEEGAKEYGPSNYLKSDRKLPASVVYNHMLNHLFLWLQGDRTEDQLAKVAWGVMTLMVLEEYRPDMLDMFEFGIKPNAFTATNGRVTKQLLGKLTCILCKKEIEDIEYATNSEFGTVHLACKLKGEMSVGAPNEYNARRTGDGA